MAIRAACGIIVRTPPKFSPSDYKKFLGDVADAAGRLHDNGSVRIISNAIAELKAPLVQRLGQIAYNALPGDLRASAERNATTLWASIASRSQTTTVSVRELTDRISVDVVLALLPAGLQILRAVADEAGEIALSHAEPGPQKASWVDPLYETLADASDKACGHRQRWTQRRVWLLGVCDRIHDNANLKDARDAKSALEIIAATLRGHLVGGGATAQDYLSRARGRRRRQPAG